MFVNISTNNSAKKINKKFVLFSFFLISNHQFIKTQLKFLLGKLIKLKLKLFSFKICSVSKLEEVIIV